MDNLKEQLLKDFKTFWFIYGRDRDDRAEAINECIERTLRKNELSGDSYASWLREKVKSMDINELDIYGDQKSSSGISLSFRNLFS